MYADEVMITICDVNIYGATIYYHNFLDKPHKMPERVSESHKLTHFCKCWIYHEYILDVITGSYVHALMWLQTSIVNKQVSILLFHLLFTQINDKTLNFFTNYPTF